MTYEQLLLENAQLTEQLRKEFNMNKQNMVTIEVEVDEREDLVTLHLSTEAARDLKFVLANAVLGEGYYKSHASAIEGAMDVAEIEQSDKWAIEGEPARIISR